MMYSVRIISTFCDQSTYNQHDGKETSKSVKWYNKEQTKIDEHAKENLSKNETGTSYLPLQVVQA
jgi:hypothetical protein